jgi:hypothetical protein
LSSRGTEAFLENIKHLLLLGWIYCEVYVQLDGTPLVWIHGSIGEGRHHSPTRRCQNYL